MLGLTYTHTRSANLRQNKSPPVRQSDAEESTNFAMESKQYESEEDAEDDNYYEGRDTFDENQFGDSSVLFQSPPQNQSHHPLQDAYQFTLNPDDNQRGNPRYMAS